MYILIMYSCGESCEIKLFIITNTKLQATDANTENLTQEQIAGKWLRMFNRNISTKS